MSLGYNYSASELSTFLFFQVMIFFKCHVLLHILQGKDV